MEGQCLHEWDSVPVVIGDQYQAVTQMIFNNISELKLNPMQEKLKEPQTRCLKLKIRKNKVPY